MLCVSQRRDRHPELQATGEELLKDSGGCLLPWSRRKPRMAQRSCVSLMLPMSAGSATGK